MKRRSALPFLALVACLCLPFPLGAAGDGPALRLHLRYRIKEPGKEGFTALERQVDWNPKETALIICDMWDDHWCKSASRRVGEMAGPLNEAVRAARKKGVFIIHAPSTVTAFYKDTPQRKRIQETPRVEPPKPLDLPDPPLPIDDSDGGCDDAQPSKTYKAWTREHPAIPIGDNDVISDNGNEVYSFLKQHGIKNLLIMGVHTNMCVCNRSFAIKQMTNWGLRPILVRDLTDSMYNPKDRPFVPHDQGTGLVIEHIEKYWAPTVLSADLLGAIRGTR